MKKLMIVAGMILPALIFAQDYKVSLIPDSLKKDADAVLRYEELQIKIKNIGKAVIKRKYAYTILNESGERFGYYEAYYDKFHGLSDISGKMFDADGKQMQSIHKKDILDMKMSDGESLISDGRVKAFAFSNNNYPYTIEFEDEITLDGIFNLPEWQPISHSKLAVQKSIYTVETPDDYKLRYKQLNFPGQPLIKTGSGDIQYTWSLQNHPALLYETNQPDWDEVTPTVLIAPTDFEFGGYKGSMVTWNSLGTFFYQLYVGRDVLPDNVKQDVHRLTDGLGSREEKIKVLYNYLQQSTHYIGIQLGLGGWQPFEAKYVAEKKYGDCKALSNYMVSLLKEAGIKANNVVIYSGSDEKGLFDDFPMNHFNHVIACAPDAKDTIWLECTDQTKSAGYMGTFTGSRKALLLSDNGGYVVSTPNYTSKENLQLRKVDAVIDDKGTLVADVNTHFTGIQQELQHELLNGQSKEREKYLNNALSLPTYTVEKNEYHETKGKVPVVDEHLRIVSPNYASVSSKRLFIIPNLFNRVKKLSNDKPRQFNFEFTYSYKDVDTIVIKIPAGYIPESIPKNVEISNNLGYYKISYEVNDNSIRLLRISERKIISIPPSEYKGVVDFFDQISKSDQAKLVLIKKEG